MAAPVLTTPARPAEAGEGREAPRRSTRRPHLRQVDLMRVTAFLAVILVHVSGTTYPFPGPWPSFGQLVLHSTRMAFFFFSTFVLFYAWYDRELRPASFIGRRLRLIGIPYLLWSTAYWFLGDQWRIHHDRAAAFHDLRVVITWGGAWYHLYFLLVTLQIAVLFPVFRWLIRATRNHHVMLLAVSAVVQAIALTVVYQHYHLGWAPAEWYRTHGFMMIPTYAFFLVSGAVAAVHLDEFHAWVTSHARAVTAIVFGTLVVTYGWFRLNMSVAGMAPVLASNALQPASLLWGAAAVLGLYAVCARWARNARGHRWISAGVELAFGVYLVHPMILRLLEMAGFTGWIPMSPFAATFVLWGIVAVLSAAFALLVSLTPLSPFVIGRERGRLLPKRQTARAAASAATG